MTYKSSIDFFPRCGILLAILLLFGSASRARVADLPVLKFARDIQQLLPEEAAKARAVRLKGVITFVDEAMGELFIQDSTAGVFIFFKQSVATTSLHERDIVVVEGVTTAGDFSPCVTNARIKVVGTGPFPSPDSPRMTCLWVGKRMGTGLEWRASFDPV